MLKRFKPAKAIALCAALTACQTSQPQQDLAVRFAVPHDHRARIADALRTALKDPYSIRSAEIAAPSQEFVGILNGGMRPAVCFRLNAKNSFGAYIGIETHVAVFDNGRAILYRNEFACNKPLGYFPFPEIEAIK